jgi:MSHA biogenesis protein MshJ
MRQQWQILAARFDALALRERALVVVAAIVGTILVFDALALEPLAVRKKRLTLQFKEARQTLKIAESAMKSPQASIDPDTVKRPYRDALRKQLGEIDQNMQGLQRGLVPPERMAKLLEEMLARSRLQLVSLRTLPVQRFESPGAAPALKAAGKAARMPGEPDRTIFQHSFEITLQGSYNDLHSYLTRLEKLPWQMFWGRISVNTEQYPRLRVTLTVQTMSLSKAWLIV